MKAHLVFRPVQCASTRWRFMDPEDRAITKFHCIYINYIERDKCIATGQPWYPRENFNLNKQMKVLVVSSLYKIIQGDQYWALQLQITVFGKCYVQLE